MNPITLALKALLVVSEKGSPDTKLRPPSSSAAMLSTVTHCWTMSFRMAPTVAPRPPDWISRAAGLAMAFKQIESAQDPLARGQRARLLIVTPTRLSRFVVMGRASWPQAGRLLPD